MIRPRKRGGRGACTSSPQMRGAQRTKCVGWLDAPKGWGKMWPAGAHTAAANVRTREFLAGGAGGAEGGRNGGSFFVDLGGGAQGYAAQRSRDARGEGQRVRQ